MGKWKFKSLADLCDFEKGKTGLAKAIPGDYPLVATGANRKSCDSYQFDTKAVCVPLVSSTGHGHKSLNYVHYEEGKFALGTILVAITPKDGQILNPQFLHLYLSELKDILLVPLMRGGANVSLSITNVKTVKIPVPSLQEQNDIVDQFNSMEKDHFSLVNEITHQQELLQKLRQSILQDAIQGKLTEQWRKDNSNVEPASELLKWIKEEKETLIKDKRIRKTKALPPITEDEISFELPDGWEWVRLGDLAQSATNGLYKKASFYKENGIASLRMYNIQNGEIEYEKIRRVLLTDDEYKQYMLEDQDLLVNRVNSKELVGKTAIIRSPKEKLVYESMNMRVRLISRKCSGFINKYILLDRTKKHFSNISKVASGQVSINQGHVLSLVVPFPTIPEQFVIVTKIEEFFTYCDQLEEQINQSKSNSELLMQTVLKEAFEN